MSDIKQNPHIFLAFLVLSVLGMAVFPSCQSSDEPETESAATPEIVFLFSPGGLGDMSYDDCILEGLQRFKMSRPEIDIYFCSPDSLEAAAEIFSGWLSREESDVPELFVLASNDYESIAEEYLAQCSLPANKSVLLFETQRQYDDPNIHSFQISMYGASYLAGVNAALNFGDRKSLVVLANDTDSPIESAKDGFIAGLGRECDVEYLADDWTGYVQSSLAYQKMSEWSEEYTFIFPVAGGSNLGIYRYSRENEDSPFLAGMDVDQSGLSNKIVGSVIKNIDDLIFEYLTEWADSGTMPEFSIYGLESGYADWQFSSSYEDCRDAVEQYRQQAITMENEYYEGN